MDSPIQSNVAGAGGANPKSGTVQNPSALEESHVIQKKSNVTHPNNLENDPPQNQLGQSFLGKSSLRNPLDKERIDSVRVQNKKVIFNGVPSPVDTPAKHSEVKE